jgi:1H-pyrrole-2-carbonyl-[peptidyl-carrier protein] chlorinase
MLEGTMKDEVVIIGGGPGGAALGCYLSIAGIHNTIIESAHHPRAHVGESMVTATTRVFEEIGFLETMEREGFIHKHGACWHPTASHAALHVKFAEFPQPGIKQDYTYHVDRSRFDLLLLKHAEKLGSCVCQGVSVKEVLFEAGHAVGVRANVAGQSVDIPARIVVDASGRQAVLGQQLRLRRTDPDFNQFSVHAWFENVDRGVRPDDIHIHFLPVRRGWVWQIPITDTVTSMGVVAEREVFRAGKGDYEVWFHELSRSAPDIALAMRDARRVNDFKIEADYSYQMDSFVGDGWLLVGDAARFVDPIFSSGVSVAMHSAKFASEQIASALAADDVSCAALAQYEARLKSGTAIWHEFIRLYYKLLPMFTAFIAREEYRLQVLQLLQGDVYDREEVPVLQAMRDFIDNVENTEGHLLQPYLDGDLMFDEGMPTPQELL